MKKSKQQAKIVNVLNKKHGQISIQKSGSQGGKWNSFSRNGADGENGNGHGLQNGNHVGHEISDKKSQSHVIDKKIDNGSVQVSNSGAFDVKKLQNLRSKGGKKTADTISKACKGEPKIQIKNTRIWEDLPLESKLDFTDPVDEKGNGSVAVVAEQGHSVMDSEEVISSDSEAEEDDEVESNTKLDAKKKGRFSSMF